MQSSRITLWLPILLAAGLTLEACRWVDEDLSECGTEYKLNYELRLVTNISTELETVLGLESDIAVADALRTYLKDIFTDYAHDVDLSFYDTTPPMERLHHEAHIMDANQSSYTLYLPVREYMHTAVANIMNNGQVALEGSRLCGDGSLVQHGGTLAAADTVSSHGTGLFSARLPMDVREGENQSFEVSLYMVNAATALVLDTKDAPTIGDIKVVAEGFATQFAIADSTYSFAGSAMVRTDDLPVEGGSQRCFASVHFPSREPAESKVVIETTEPFISNGADNALWGWKTYVRCADGTLTETVLGVQLPVRAGQLKIIKAFVTDDGAVHTETPHVGVSVTLDWNEGGRHEIEL